MNPRRSPKENSPRVDDKVNGSYSNQAPIFQSDNMLAEKRINDRQAPRQAERNGHGMGGQGMGRSPMNNDGNWRGTGTSSDNGGRNDGDSNKRNNFPRNKLSMEKEIRQRHNKGKKDSYRNRAGDELMHNEKKIYDYVDNHHTYDDYAADENLVKVFQDWHEQRFEAVLNDYRQQQELKNEGGVLYEQEIKHYEVKSNGGQAPIAPGKEDGLKLFEDALNSFRSPNTANMGNSHHMNYMGGGGNREHSRPVYANHGKQSDQSDNPFAGGNQKAQMMQHVDPHMGSGIVHQKQLQQYPHYRPNQHPSHANMQPPPISHGSKEGMGNKNENMNTYVPYNDVPYSSNNRMGNINPTPLLMHNTNMPGSYPHDMGPYKPNSGMMGGRIDPNSYVARDKAGINAMQGDVGPPGNDLGYDGRMDEAPQEHGYDGRDMHRTGMQDVSHAHNGLNRSRANTNKKNTGPYSKMPDGSNPHRSKPPQNG